MKNSFKFIGTAWNYYRSQSVLNAVIFWLLFIPGYLMWSLDTATTTNPYLKDLFESGVIFDGLSNEVLVAIAIILVVLVLSIMMIWGVACTFMVGKKLMLNRAGRTRSSFKTVSKQGSKFVANIFLTSILRFCFTIFWSILLIVPGIIYSIRTYFFAVIIVNEKKGYRQALQASKDVVKGHTWLTLWYLLVTGILVYLPLMVVSAVYGWQTFGLTGNLVYAANLVPAAVQAVTIVVHSLTVVCIYAHLKKLPKQVKP